MMQRTLLPLSQIEGGAGASVRMSDCYVHQHAKPDAQQMALTLRGVL